MALFGTEDSNGHVRSEADVLRLREAISLLNADATVGACEENANHHSEARFREEMARDFHVANVDEWTPDEHEPENYEEGECTICGGYVTKLIKAEPEPEPETPMTLDDAKRRAGEIVAGIRERMLDGGERYTDAQIWQAIIDARSCVYEMVAVQLLDHVFNGRVPPEAAHYPKGTDHADVQTKDS